MKGNYMPRTRNTMIPQILVLEGMMGDTCDLITAAGGEATESNPWSYQLVERALLSGYYDGLVLTGGSDINPKLYGEEIKSSEVYGIDLIRDETEVMALEIAKKQGIPVLGICRGSQIMCAFRGGKLYQHIGTSHRGGHHMVYAAPEAKTWKRACNSRDMEVISIHHQCVRRPGKGMRIAAYAHDGTPEAIESKDGLWLGVQYHPEMAGWDNANCWAIFEWLVGAAARVRGGRAPKRPFRNSAQYRAEAQSWMVEWWRKRQERQEENDYFYHHDGYQLPQTTSTAVARLPRKAGEPSLPSMRETSR